MTNPISAPLPQLTVDRIAVTRSETRPGQVQVALDKIVALASRGLPTSFRATIKYATDARIPVPVGNGTETFRLQVGPRDSNISAYRAEFDPIKLGPIGMNAVDELLSAIAGLSLHEFVADGIVTGLDVSLGIDGFTLNDIVADQKSAQIIGLSTKRGKPEVLEFGGTQKTIIRNAANGQEAGAPPKLRVERQVRQSYNGSELPKIKNPFAGLTMIPTQALIAAIGGVPPDIFFDSARTRGLRSAVAMMPVQEQQRLQTIINQFATAIIPNNLWASWPTILKSSGLSV